ncbi:hypothetical protein ACFXTN_025277 [Malus domestica]
MNNCVVFRDDIQSWIDKGKLKFPEKQMAVDVDPFPSATVDMVDAHLPKNKGKGKAEFEAGHSRIYVRLHCKEDQRADGFVQQLQGTRHFNRTKGETALDSNTMTAI